MNLKKGVNKRTEMVSIKIPKPDVPKGLFRKCKKCGGTVLSETVKQRGYVCPKCGYYFRVHAKRRIEMIADEGSFEPWFEGLPVSNPLEDKDYETKLKEIKEKTKLDEAVLTGKVSIGGQPAAVAIMDGRFLMASMGKVVGEKIALTVERATKDNLPVIIFSCSGGARMQEGIISLMQMAKTSAALKKHSDSGNLYISVLTDPTTGGVTASFAMLGDIILAEPGALVGFAGPRVIEETIKQKLPKGFQRSEFLLEHGFVDAIVERTKLKKTLRHILKLHSKNESKSSKSENEILLNTSEGNDVSEKVVSFSQYKTPWERVLLSRDNDRPTGMDYIDVLTEDFIEMHGDRYYKDDPSVVGGIAWMGGRAVTVIAQVKGHTTKENVARNFAMPSPDGYRKALRLMKQAEKFGRPIICFVDTPGAFCGIEAEERGQGEAIARNLYEMSAITVPILSVIIGEGGSGGALAMAVANEVWMLENSVYSILSPEGYASILWKDGKLAEKAAGLMSLTAQDLKNLGVIERVFAEPFDYSYDKMRDITEQLRAAIYEFINKYGKMSPEEVAEHRYQRFRSI